jgi:GR25 family glycosyltransferase involved in LPS biosynthesis
MINQHFDKIFCINLKRRPDRLIQAMAEFEKFNVSVEFVEAVDGLTLPMDVEGLPSKSKDGRKISRGDLGCTYTHLKIVKLAKEQGLRNYFVFEDDVEFSPDFNEVFDVFFNQLPENWDMLYLGGNHTEGYEMITRNIAKIFHTYTTHAIGVKSSAYDSMIKVLSEKEKVDICIAELHKSLNCYVTRPHLAFQRASFSDILDENADYKHLRN